MTATNPIPEQLLASMRDAAKMLSISERTLWARTKSGEIPHLKIGSRILYPIDELREYIRANTNRPLSP